jgi:hypothetical protein
MITNAQADVLSHTSNNGRYVGEGHALMELAKLGLLRDHGPQALAGGAHYLTMTPKGREALNEWRAAQPKAKKARRRSEQFAGWRAYCEACRRISFPEFLREVWPNRSRYV